MSISLLIVVPTLDSYLLLPRLVGSLQHQTWSDWRVVFIDGPSCAKHRHWLSHCCEHDSRFTWLEQSPVSPGIFGAMNQGFAQANSDDWLLFWGSDDWASTPHVFSSMVSAINNSSGKPDLLVCKGRYADANTAALRRSTQFQSAGVLDSGAYRRALWQGSIPPHQATLFGPGSRSLLSRYSTGFRLSADLDYFLRLSSNSGLRVQCLDLELVHMADGGVSGQQTRRRLLEVSRAYRRTFGCRWWFPFFARYVRRLSSLVES